MNLQNLKNLFSSFGCRNIYVKKLSPNDNSKNQVYLGGSFDILNIFPTSEILSVPAGIWKKDRFKAAVNFSWITEDSVLAPAPDAQLILYPKYPEVRFSGFLKKCSSAPSGLMASRTPGRVLFISVTSEGRLIGYVSGPDSEITNEFLNLVSLPEHGVFSIIEIISQSDNRISLLKEMYRINNLGWINSKRLGSSGEILPCLAPNCGGYTLEAELGITPNGYSEPDFKGWEVKQFGVDNFTHINNQVITLMTPEPTHGFYVDSGVEAFIRKYGYPDKKGRADRLNFGGVHKAGKLHPTTNLCLQLIGFDAVENKIKRSDGRISLIDTKGNEAASWSFASLLQHWNRKHNLACYVPSLHRNEPQLQYYFGHNLILGTGTDFILFLKQLNFGNIYYDPGIKLENISVKPEIKRRSQFRIKSGFLSNLYYSSETVNVLS